MKIKTFFLFFYFSSFVSYGLHSSSLKAPDFRLFDDKGKIFVLSKQTHPVIILYFFNSQYSVCQKEIKETIKFKNANNNILFIGIIVDDRADQTVKYLRQNININFSVLYGTKDVIDRYQIKTIPMTFILTNGYIMYTHKGYFDKLEMSEKLSPYFKIHE